MKRILIIFFCAIGFLQGYSQKYGNEWINFNQDYFKIKIFKEGIYKIDYNTLQTAGFPLTSTNPKNIQIWLKGEEMPIIVSGESDGNFDPTDFIEFYANYNDGNLDSVLFRKGEQPHKYMSLYNDTAVYFLTVGLNAGKRMPVFFDNDYNGKTPEPYFFYEQVNWFNNKNSGTYWDGFGFAPEGFYTDYTEGEGWSKTTYGASYIYSTPFFTPFVSANGPKAFVEVLAHTRGSNTSAYDADGYNNGLRLTIDPSGTIVEEKRVVHYSKYFFQDSIEKTLIGSPNTTLKTNSFLLAKSAHSVSYFKLIYPRLFNLGDSSSIKFNYNSANNFIKFSNYQTTKNKPVIYDLTNYTKSIGSKTLNDIYINLYNSANEKTLYLTDESKIINLTSGNVLKYVFNEIKLNNAFDYLIISHPKLDSGAKAYRDFLSSSTGGGYNPYVVYVNDIYDQFYFGQKHPEAMKNFCRFAINNDTSLKFLLLLGKGQKYYNSRFNPLVYSYLDLVPTYGNPPSDYYFTSGYNGSFYEPLLATGRVPAINNSQVAIYLKKLYDIKSAGYQPWKKKILHLAGGETTSDVAQFSNFQEAYHNIVKKQYWGASKRLITKRDPSPVDSSLKEMIQNEINMGYSLIDYFGHGSAQASDIDFGDASSLKNYGKYPFFYFNGCALGNTYDGSSIAEDYLFAKDKGAIGWMGQTTFGYIGELHPFSLAMHLNLTENPKLSFAQNIKNTIKNYQNSSSPYNASQCKMMIFSGEPSLRIFDAELPDYTIDVTQSSIYPPKVTADADSFALKLNILNLGLHSGDTFYLKVSQKLSGGNVINYPQKYFNAVGNSDTVLYWIKKTEGVNKKGANTFTITIDSSNIINEQMPLGESNNTVYLSHYFGSANAQILYPAKDAIVSNTQVQLSAQSLAFGSNNYNFIFELDTTPFFNSLFKKNSGNIVSSYIAKADFSLLPVDSIDYYWRVKIDDGSGKGIWDISTFSMIYNSPEGWSQGDKRKFIDAQKTDIGYDSLNIFMFATKQSTNYGIETGGKNAKMPVGRTIWHNGSPLNWGYAHGKGISVVAYSALNENRFYINSKFNKVSYPAWWTPAPSEVKYYIPSGVAKTCNYLYNTFNKEDRDSFLALLKTIPKDYYLMIINQKETNISSWETEIFDELEKFGGLKLRTSKDNDPFIFVGRRGYLPGTAFEKLPNPNDVLPSDQQVLLATYVLGILADSGSINSYKIGPATKWKSFYRTLHKPDNTGDLLKFNIYGINKDNDEFMLYKGITKREFLLDSVDASIYPFLKIEADIEDSIIKTPTEIKRWTVLYDGYPEGMILPSSLHYQNKDTLDEGDTLKVKTVYKNISKYNFDSLLIITTSTNEQNKIDTIDFIKYKPLAPGDSIVIVRNIITTGLSANNVLNITVNPEMTQPELYLFNNTQQFNYYVKNDIKNPYLDVVFDGRHIINMEIISPTPQITMTSSDDNKFFYMNDPEFFKVKLKEPGSSTFRILNLKSDTFEFKPANNPAEKCDLIYKPKYTKDGIYELAVSVRDAKGNFSSADDYKIAYHVVTKSTITNVYPYPNPFTSKTRFVFTLTGNKIPENFKITILAVSGRIVKEITMEELGTINIGNNISQFEWDGTDNYGDKLANGVYLYKVSAKIDGKNIELSESAGDIYFKNGYGKLYIMR
ncbi:MAG: hypothetical protein HUU47_03300 [Bacteroidetes bacterium]|nr:hypothetical protein [Bacteroidota bacterium]